MVGAVRCLALESAISKLPWQCSNKHAGCNFMGSKKKVLMHQKEDCKYTYLPML